MGCTFLFLINNKIRARVNRGQVIQLTSNEAEIRNSQETWKTGIKTELPETNKRNIQRQLSGAILATLQPTKREKLESKMLRLTALNNTII